MKKIAAVIAASLGLLAFTSIGASADRLWGLKTPVVDLGSVGSLDWWAEGRPIISAYASLTGVTPKATQVVAVPVNPTLIRAPGVLAGALAPLGPALETVRKAVAGDAVLKGALAAEGYTPANVIGVGQKDGQPTLFVGNAV